MAPMKFVVWSIEREETRARLWHQTDLTVTARNGIKESFRRGVTLAELCRTLPAILDSASQQCNVIVRPHGPGVSFIQLDDLKADMRIGLL